VSHEAKIDHFLHDLQKTRVGFDADATGEFFYPPAIA